MSVSDEEAAPQAAEVSTSPPKASRSTGKKGNVGQPKAKVKPAKVKAKAKAKPAQKAKAKPGKAKAKPGKAKRQRDPAKLDQFGYRKGTTRSKAAQIYARKKGATLAEVKEVVGSIQFNLLNEQRKRGNKLREVDETNKNGRAVKRYFLAAA